MRQNDAIRPWKGNGWIVDDAGFAFVSHPIHTDWNVGQLLLGI
jgi:hypothetical protein